MKLFYIRNIFINEYMYVKVFSLFLLASKTKEDSIICRLVLELIYTVRTTLSRMRQGYDRPKGPAKLGNIVAETLLRMQMFPSLAARETYVAETNFAARKQKMFLPEVKNIFVSRTQILCPQHMFPSLAAIETMLISFQCRSRIKRVSQQRRAY